MRDRKSSSSGFELETPTSETPIQVCDYKIRNCGGPKVALSGRGTVMRELASGQGQGDG